MKISYSLMTLVMGFILSWILMTPTPVFAYDTNSHTMRNLSANEGYKVPPRKIRVKVTQKKSVKKKYTKKKSSKKYAGYSGGHTCLPASVKAMLGTIKSKWGSVRIGSSYRKGARVAKTGKRSYHASCRAVDFNVPSKYYWQVASYLKKNWNGGVGTYSGKHHHIHIDNGRRSRWHN